MTQEPTLTVDEWLAFDGDEPHVTTVAQHDPGPEVIGKIHGEDFLSQILN